MLLINCILVGLRKAQKHLFPSLISLHIATPLLCADLCSVFTNHNNIFFCLSHFFNRSGIANIIYIV